MAWSIISNSASKLYLYPQPTLFQHVFLAANDMTKVLFRFNEQYSFTKKRLTPLNGWCRGIAEMVQSLLP